MAAPGALPPPSLQFASLYVGDLHPDVTEAILYEAFQEAGSVASCRVCRDGISRKSLGYGYVNYYNVEDAEKALETLNYMQVKGRSCRVMWSQRDPALRKEAQGNIFVKNLSESIDNKALHDTFSIFGHILSCKVQTDASGKSKGYGFVHYEAEEAAQQAIERVNGMEVGGQQVFVGPFLKRTEMENSDPDHFTNLYVRNLPEAWTEDTLTDKFKGFGEILSSVIMQNTDGKRFALVNYKEAAAAKAAIASLHRKPVRELDSDVPEGAKPASECTEEAPAPSVEPKPTEDDTKVQETGVEDAAADAGASPAEEDFPSDLLYVQRAQTRAERREQMLKDRGKQKGGKSDRPPGVRLCVRNLSESVTSDDLREMFKPHGQVLTALAKTDDAGACRGLGFVVMSSMEEATKAIAEMHLKVEDGKPLNVGLAEKRKPRQERGSEAADHEGTATAEGKRGGKGKSGEDKGKGKGKKKDGKGKGKGSGGGPPPQIRPPGPFPFGVQPPLSLGVMPGLAPGFPGGLGGMPGSPMGGVRPATYTLPPAMSAGRPVAAPTQGPTPMPPGTLLHGPIPGTVPPGAMLRPPLAFPQGAPLPPSFPRVPLPPISREVLAQLHPQAQKQQLGERLFPLISRTRPDLAGKITGMMLELDNNEIMKLLENESVLKKKIDEAVNVLDKKR